MKQTRLVSGTVYQFPWPVCWRICIVFIDSRWVEKKLVALYGMLHLDRHENPLLTAPRFQHDKEGRFMFSEKELIKIWRMKEWRQLNERIDFVPAEDKGV